MLKRSLAVLFILFIHSAKAQDLIVAANPVSGEQRTAFNVQIEAFKRAHPNISVSLNIYEHETFKKTVEESLAKKSALADILFWFGGASLRHFADQQWIQPVTALWQAEDWDNVFSAASKQAVTRGEDQFGLPLYYYQWGIYYRKSLFSQLKLHPAQTWEQLLMLGKKLNQNNIKPFTIGTKNHWPAAGWFDYLNLRLNGLKYHESLLGGCISFTDTGVKQVFEHWQQLLRQNFFIDHTERLAWKDALPYLYHNKAGMLLMGNFFLASVPETLSHDIGFFPFPTINPVAGRYEDAPIDVLIIPKQTENRDAAEQFMRFMARAENQSTLASSLGMIPPNRLAELSDNALIRQGSALLNQAQGLAQFFDRDTHPVFTKLALPLFSEFMDQPDKLNTILSKLELARQEVWQKSPDSCN